MAFNRATYLLLAALIGGCTVKPLPFTDAELDSAGQELAARAVADSERISKPVGLYEAMARALKHNLNARVEALDAAWKMRQLDLASADQLPQLVSSLDYSARNNDSASSSQSLATGNQSLVQSISTDRQVATSDLTLSWNILDFGLSYVRANQMADKALIGAEKRRKAVHTLLQDVRTAFWKTATSEIISRRMKDVSGRMRVANEHVHALEAQGVSPLFTLTYRRDVLELEVEIQRLYAELLPSKIQLANLMNVSPEANFQVSPSRTPRSLPGALPTFGEMTEVALQERPELREAGYNSRVNKREAEIALLELLPGIAPFLSANTDTNSFLYNSNWVSAGAKASWNLMKVFTYPQRRASVEAEANLLDKKALATAVAIMTEVQVSRMNFLRASEKFRIAQEFYSVENKLLKQMSSSHDAGTIGEHTLLRQEMRVLLAEAKRNVAYADYENAFGMLFVSMGTDVARDVLDADLPIEQLSEALEFEWRSRCKFTLKMNRQVSVFPTQQKKPI